MYKYNLNNVQNLEFEWTTRIFVFRFETEVKNL